MVEPKQNGDELEEKIDKRLALLRDKRGLRKFGPYVKW